MKFDFVIGNPPYQDETVGENKTYAAPVYDKFIDSAYEIGNSVEMIHPARFLFNAGSTPKEWNKKMLEDPHLKVLMYEQDSSKIFNGTDIKGGIVVTYRNKTQLFGAIKVFTPYQILRCISDKIADLSDYESISTIVFTQNRFDLDSLYAKHPEYRQDIGSDGKDKRFRNNIFEKIPEFSEKRRTNDDIEVIGVIKNKRVWRYISKIYVDIEHENIFTYKVIVPRANGTGALGEILSSPAVLCPNQGYTQTFIGLGSFQTEQEAQNELKYIKSKFARTLLSVLKVDQHNEKDTWKYVPLQDFTANSDIDWSKSIADIDRQLYKKYNLSDEEINFIETKVKEMA